MRIPDAVHEELQNWSRWCWMGEWPHPMPPTHCGSLESQYRAPPEWDMELAEAPTNYIRPNTQRAQVVQAVYDSLQPPERQVLKAEYPARHTSGRSEGKATAAARLNIPTWAYDRHLESAIQQVEAAFAVRA